MSHGLLRIARNRAWSGYDVVRIALGAILLLAAGLKAYQLATEPTVGSSLLDSRWLLMATVEFELFFGLWLIAGILPKPTWAAALACFGLFTCVSLYKALSGHATCGCFGRVPVNPWYTSTLDLAIVLSLLRWRPKESLFATRQAVAVMVIWLAVGLPAAFAMGSHYPTTLSDDGDIIGNGTVVILEPEKWIGKRFPLLDYIDIADRLKEGKWLVVLFHHDCPKCLEAISKYEEQARRWADNPTTPRVAMIEMPPFDLERSRLPLSSDTPCVLGQLSEDRTWFVETPVVVVVGLESARVCPVTMNQYVSRLAVAHLGRQMAVAPHRQAGFTEE
jgi:hypothetical protein